MFAVKYAVQCYRALGLFTGTVHLYLPKTNDLDRDYIINEVKEYFSITEYDEGSVLRIGSCDISFFKTVHSIDSFSIKVEAADKKIVYSGDMGYHDISSFCEFCRDADIFICEATFLENEGKNNQFHLHTNEVSEIASEANVKKLIITHMWPEHSKDLYLNEIKRDFESVFAAEEKDSYEL